MNVSDAHLRRLSWGLASLLAAGVAAGALVLVAERAQTAPGQSLVSASGQFGSYVVLISFPVTGLVILLRQPRNRIGWLLMGVGLVWWVGLVADAYSRYGLLVDPGSLPAADVAALVNAVIWAPALGLIGTFLVLLFPDGRLPSPRWRPVAWLCATTIVALPAIMLVTPGPVGAGPVPALRNPLGVAAARPVLEPLLGTLVALFPLCILLCAVAGVVRFRRSRGTERLQLKWLATAAAVVAAAFATGLAASFLTGSLTGDVEEPAWMGLLNSVSFFSFLLLPGAIGVAVQRHNLYGIDVVINRTLVYGSLTIALGGLYAGSVLLLQLVLSPLTSSSDLAVAASTLAVAALFGPVRSRIQLVVDRRFYRNRYDAAGTVDAFATRLRHELDLDALTDDLRSTVEQTVHPVHVSLWLRP